MKQIEAHQGQNETPAKAGADSRVMVDTVARANLLSIHDKEGRKIFSGSPQQLMIFWKNKDYGQTDNIGGISGEDDKSIIRFGAVDGNGFVDRKRVSEIFEQLQNSLGVSDSRAKEKNELKTQEQAARQQDLAKVDELKKGLDGENVAEKTKEELLQEVKDRHKKLYFEKRHNLQDDAFLVAHGSNPENGEKLYDKVDGEVGMHFDAHGIAKVDQLGKLLQLLQTGIDQDRPFSSAPFELSSEMRGIGAGMGTAGGTAYKDGIAVLTSGYKEGLKQAGIKHVFLNDVYAAMKEPLQKLFPQYGVHLLSEQKKVLETEARAAEAKIKK